MSINMSFIPEPQALRSNAKQARFRGQVHMFLLQVPQYCLSINWSHTTISLFDGNDAPVISASIQVKDTQVEVGPAVAATHWNIGSVTVVLARSCATTSRWCLWSWQRRSDGDVWWQLIFVFLPISRVRA